MHGADVLFQPGRVAHSHAEAAAPSHGQRAWGSMVTTEPSPSSHGDTDQADDPTRDDTAECCGVGLRGRQSASCRSEELPLALKAGGDCTVRRKPGRQPDNRQALSSLAMRCVIIVCSLKVAKASVAK